MAYAVVQHKRATEAVSTNFTTTWGSATTAGNLLVAYIGMSVGATLSNAQGWSLADATNLGHQLWYKANCSASEADPSFTFTGATTGVLHIAEVSGIATSSPLDQIKAQTASANIQITLTSPAGTSGDFVYAGADAVTATAWSAPSTPAGEFQVNGLTDLDNGTTTLPSDTAWGTANGTTPSITFHWTTASNGGGVLATFKVAAVALPPTPPIYGYGSN